MSSSLSSDESRTPFLIIGFIACLAVFVHGYHPGADDAEIYIPAIKQVADPGLYPLGGEFFQSHAHLSLFPDLIGHSAQLTGISVNWVIFSWHVLCVFLLLAACWQLLGVCFSSPRARWSGVALMACVLTVPVAGTALVIMDPYLTARSLSTPASLFALAFCLRGRMKSAAACLLLTALVHPQMSIYAGLACLALLQFSREPVRIPLLAWGFLPLAIFPSSFALRPAEGTYREVLFSRSYFFVSTWTWYEWAGVFAPLAILWWISWKQPAGSTAACRVLSRALVPFGLLFTAAAAMIASAERLQNFARLQPMRSFQLIYLVLFALLGGLLGETILGKARWRWVAFFIPLGCCMWLLQRDAFPNSAHVEWPGVGSSNPWTTAFLWIRDHTPKDAFFALDPNYMLMAGEDEQGFRAIAERSALADFAKDSGAVSLFPQLARHWKEQVDAERGWRKFSTADFENLATRFPITWILTAIPAPVGLVCPYRNERLVVCQLAAPELHSSLRY